ncbi:MAG: sensor histidine kinase, partial [Vitreimonas sp.]
MLATVLGLNDPDQPWPEEVRQEQIASLYRNLLLGMSSTWAAGGVLALLLMQQRAIGTATLVVWFTLITLLTGARLVLAAVYMRAPDAKQNWRRWGAWFTAGTIASGAAWGIGSIFLMAPDRFDLQLLVIVLISAVVYGALAAFAHWAPAFFGFFLPAMVPSAVWSLFQGDVVHLAYGVLACIWIPAISWLALRFYASGVRALSLGFENAALAQDLRRQKELADNANTEKSRFLAAASHDLRQPVHALGLFVGALKNEKVEPPAARLVEHIDVAAGSLEELFTALLDVSRLDAGVVQPQPRAVALRPMIQRLVGEMRPAAEAKGLALRLNARDLWAMSDAVMLERVVRNLLSNAVR